MVGVTALHRTPSVSTTSSSVYSASPTDNEGFFFSFANPGGADFISEFRLPPKNPNGSSSSSNNNHGHGTSKRSNRNTNGTNGSSPSRRNMTSHGGKSRTTALLNKKRSFSFDSVTKRPVIDTTTNTVSTHQTTPSSIDTSSRPRPPLSSLGNHSFSYSRNSGLQKESALSSLATPTSSTTTITVDYNIRPNACKENVNQSSQATLFDSTEDISAAAACSKTPTLRRTKSLILARRPSSSDSDSNLVDQLDNLHLSKDRHRKQSVCTDEYDYYDDEESSEYLKPPKVKSKKRRFGKLSKVFSKRHSLDLSSLDRIDTVHSFSSTDSKGSRKSKLKKLVTGDYNILKPFRRSFEKFVGPDSFDESRYKKKKNKKGIMSSSSTSNSPTPQSPTLSSSNSQQPQRHSHDGAVGDHPQKSGWGTVGWVANTLYSWMGYQGGEEHGHEEGKSVMNVVNDEAILRSPSRDQSMDLLRTPATGTEDHRSMSPSSSRQTASPELALPPIRLVGRKPDTPALMNTEIGELLREHFPPLQKESSSWTLLYSMDQHGISLNTLYQNAANRGPALLVIKESSGRLFGGFVTEPFEPRNGFYGTGQCFLWRQESENNTVKVWHATGVNEYLIHAELDFIAMGGGDGVFGLWLDGELYNGYSAPCPTFKNDTLSPTPEFFCIGLELWSFKV